jgi:hypothetical protein
MKHAASLSIALWVMALATGLVWLGQYAQPRLLLPYNEPSDATAGAIELAQLQAGLSQLRALAGPLSQAPSAGALLALAPGAGSASLATSAAQTQGAVPLRAVLPKRNVSLVYVAAGFRRAVIDGLYVQPGSVLPGNARVLEIQREAVVITEGGMRRVLKVDVQANAIGHVSPAGS